MDMCYWLMPVSGTPIITTTVQHVTSDNLRNHDWDFGKLWYSPKMEARREKVSEGCFCTHESNCYYPSLPFNPGHLVEIKKIEREMKEAATTVNA